MRTKEQDDELKELIREIVKEHPEGIDKNILAEEVVRRWKKKRQH